MKVSVDTSELRTIAKAMRLAGKEAPLAIAQALNRTGGKTKTRMVKALSKQTGLKQGIIRKALRPTKAKPRSLVYRIRSNGGDVSLKFFRPRETKAGVTAYPFGKATQLPSHFTKGGRPGRRVVFKKATYSGHVFHRIGGRRLELVDSGVVIPDEMLKGASLEAFFEAVARDLPADLASELLRILPGK